MKIEITIDCDTISEFQSHLLKLFEQSIIYCHKNKDEIDPGIDEFPSVDFEEIEKELSDCNCYGSHDITITYP